jgi:hypothetical protein
MCGIDGCEGKAVAKGLCAKHYARLRRHGNADKTCKPGPKPHYTRDVARAYFPERSSRSQARIALAYELMSGFPENVRMEICKAASRPNGSLNVSCMLSLIRIMRADGPWQPCLPPK